MSEFFKKNQEEAEKANEWLNQFRPSFETAIERIEKFQERRLFNLEIIALVLGGAFLVNLLSTATFDLLLSSIPPVALYRTILDASISLTCFIIIIAIFFVFRKELLKYQPRKPVLTLLIKPEDTKPFLSEDFSKAMMDFLAQGKLKNFKLFGDSLFESLKTMLPQMFGSDFNGNPLNEQEELIDTNHKKLHKEFVSMRKEYDLSNFKSGGVKFSLTVSLVPHVIYEFATDDKGIEHDKSAIYAFYLAYGITIINPDHYHAREALESYYLLYASSVIQFSGFAIANAFKKVDKAFFDNL